MRESPNAITLELDSKNVIQLEYKMDFFNKHKKIKNTCTVNVYSSNLQNKKLACYERKYINTELKIRTMNPILLKFSNPEENLTNRGLLVMNSPFLTESLQQYEIKILLWNFDTEDYVLPPHFKIAELSFEIPQHFIQH